MIFGKLIGGVLGFLIGQIPGAIVGVLLGHLFDRGYSQVQQHLRPSPERLKRLQDTFFTTVFSLMGHLAKADGRISEEEIAQTETFMSQMGLSADHRREAIDLFKAGAKPDFDMDATLRDFRAVCGLHANLVQMLLVYLINIALADGRFDPAEESLLRRVAQTLGINGAAFEQLVRMIKAQDAFGGAAGGSAGGGAGAAPRQDQLELAYQALGVEAAASDAEIKRAYRKLMSQYHPDKLTGQGVPDDMIKAATERSQEIQTAYDTIKKARQR